MNEKNNNDIINQIQQKLVDAEFDFAAYMNLVVEQMMIITPATGVIIELAEGDEMVYRAASGSAKNYLGLRLPMKNSITGLCVSSHTVLKCDDTETDPRVNLEACRKVGARSMVVAPLFYNGQAIGVLKIVSDKVANFSDKDIHNLQLMAGVVASGIALQRLQEMRDFF